MYIYHPKTINRKNHIFLHAACFSSCKTTFIQVIKRNFLVTWPHLSEKAVMKYIRASDATILGHLDHQWKNRMSTKRIKQSPEEIQEDIEPRYEKEKAKTNNMFLTMIDATQKIFTDQTRNFLTKSLKGNEYLMIIYVYDCNAMLIKTMKNKSENELNRVYSDINEHFKKGDLNQSIND